MTWTYIISDLKGKEIDRRFYQKELQKTSQEGFKKLKNYTLNEKTTIVRLTVGLIKKI